MRGGANWTCSAARAPPPKAPERTPGQKAMAHRPSFVSAAVERERSSCGARWYPHGAARAARRRARISRGRRKPTQRVRAWGAPVLRSPARTRAAPSGRPEAPRRGPARPSGADPGIFAAWPALASSAQPDALAAHLGCHGPLRLGLSFRAAVSRQLQVSRTILSIPISSASSMRAREQFEYPRTVS